MKDYITLGPVPSDENCQQVGTETYDHRKAMLECKNYKEQLERQFNIPYHTEMYFAVKGFPHDFGTYHEVVVYYNIDREEELDFALNIDHNLPSKWDDISRKKLGIN